LFPIQLQASDAGCSVSSDVHLTANFSNLVSFFLAPGDKLSTTPPICYLLVNHTSVAKDLIALAAITTDSATYGVCPSVIAFCEFNFIISPDLNIASNWSRTLTLHVLPFSVVKNTAEAFVVFGRERLELPSWNGNHKKMG